MTFRLQVSFLNREKVFCVSFNKRYDLHSEAMTFTSICCDLFCPFFLSLTNRCEQVQCESFSMDGFNRVRFDFPDSDVQGRVSNFLHNKKFPAFRDINVEVHHGTVTLTGSVCSYYEKQVALNTCQRVAGVLSMIDHIDVESIRDTSALDEILMEE